MAEVSLLGGLVGCSINGIPREQGITEVYTGSIFPVVVATAGGLCGWVSNLLSATQGVTTVIPGVRQAFPVEANAVFLHMPKTLAAGLDARGWHFYDFIGGAYRLMCSWDTTAEDVAALVRDARELAGLKAAG